MKWSWPILRYYPRSCLEGVRKTMKSLCDDIWCPGQNLNQGLPKYQSEVLLL
jgi:hypothetical protein